MESKKNTPPRGVVIAILLIIVMIIVYFILAFVFPEIFNGLQSGEIEPIKNG